MKDTYLMTKNELSEYLASLIDIAVKGGSLTEIERLYVQACGIGRGVAVEKLSDEQRKLAAYLEGIGCCFPANCGKHEAVLYRCYILGKGEI